MQLTNNDLKLGAGSPRSKATRQCFAANIIQEWMSFVPLLQIWSLSVDILIIIHRDVRYVKYVRQANMGPDKDDNWENVKRFQSLNSCAYSLRVYRTRAYSVCNAINKINLNGRIIESWCRTLCNTHLIEEHALSKQRGIAPCTWSQVSLSRFDLACTLLWAKSRLHFPAVVKRPLVGACSSPETVSKNFVNYFFYLCSPT